MPVLERQVTDTYTAPSGVVVVVTGVPAHVFVNEDGREQITYDYEVAERLDIFNTVALNEGGEPGQVKVYSFNQHVTAPMSDLQFRIVGEGIHFGSTPLKVWKKAFDRIYYAYTSLSKTLANALNFSVPVGPRVALSPGSLVIGLRASDQKPLLPDLIDQSDVVGQTLTLLMDASKWLETEDDASLPELMRNPQVFDAALRAVEDIAPSERDEAEVVELLSEQKGKRVRTRLTSVTRKKAIEKRIDHIVKQEKASRLEFKGKLYAINMDNRLEIREINHSDLGRTKLKLTITEMQRTEVLALFGRQVRVVSLHHRSASIHGPYELISLEAIED